MNKTTINDEEIARLMRVTSELLRRSWEKVMGTGKLEDVISSREMAITQQKTSKRGLNLSLLFLLLIAISWSAVLFGTGDQRYGWTTMFPLKVVAAVISLFAVSWSVIHFSNTSNKMLCKIDECEKILAKFQVSVDALNPLGIGNRHHDVLTVALVFDRIEDLAYKVIDAEDRFERLLKPGAIRSDVIRAGQWIEKCDTWFDRIWTAATVDFTLIRIDKREVFARAAVRFRDIVGRSPAHLG